MRLQKCNGNQYSRESVATCQSPYRLPNDQLGSGVQDVYGSFSPKALPQVSTSLFFLCGLRACETAWTSRVRRIHKWWKHWSETVSYAISNTGLNAFRRPAQLQMLQDIVDVIQVQGPFMATGSLLDVMVKLRLKRVVRFTWDQFVLDVASYQLISNRGKMLFLQAIALD